MKENYTAIIVITLADYLRVRENFERILNFLPAKNITVIGQKEIADYIAKDNYDGRLNFIEENSLVKFEDVEKTILEILKVDKIGRGVVGWYYQQFLKMKYATICEDEYYLTWDGDTIPTKAFSMFDATGEKPLFHMKYENHEEYFITIKTLLGMDKIIRKSFISEHMLFNKQIMLELIKAIENNNTIEGNYFYEKIMHSIRKSEVLSNSFSEFETYGTYVAYKHSEAYRLREWHSIRYGSLYFKPEELTETDYEWIGKDFDAISFEKNQDYNPEIAKFFFDPKYREKLTARQVVEAIQDSSSEGLREEWNN